MEPVGLTTERLLLRAMEPGDVEAVRLACQDPDIPRWTPLPSPYTDEHARAWVEERAPKNWREDTGYNFGVFSRDDGRLVGSMGLVRLELDTPRRVAELGYWTAKEARGHGYTAEAARAVCEWAFEALGVERIDWCAEIGNDASRAVALKVGFRMEGTARSYLVHLGARRDAWLASLLPSDWGRPQETPYVHLEQG